MAVNRKENVYVGAVIVDVTHGDHLTYKVTVRGATPAKFTLVDANTKTLIWSSAEGPTATDPDFVYEREWPKAGDSAQPQTQTSHSMGFQFLGVREIKYEVVLHHEIGIPMTLFDIDYQTSEDNENYTEDLMVTVF